MGEKGERKPTAKEARQQRLDSVSTNEGEEGGKDSFEQQQIHFFFLQRLPPTLLEERIVGRSFHLQEEFHVCQTIGRACEALFHEPKNSGFQYNSTSTGMWTAMESLG